MALLGDIGAHSSDSLWSEMNRGGVRFRIQWPSRGLSGNRWFSRNDAKGNELKLGLLSFAMHVRNLRGGSVLTLES